MRRIVVGLSLLVAFLVGCLASSVVTPQVFHVPPARAGSTPQKWEYSCIATLDLEKAQQATMRFSQMGSEGWELVTYTSRSYVNFLEGQIGRLSWRGQRVSAPLSISAGLEKFKVWRGRWLS